MSSLIGSGEACEYARGAIDHGNTHRSGHAAHPALTGFRKLCTCTCGLFSLEMRLRATSAAVALVFSCAAIIGCGAGRGAVQRLASPEWVPSDCRGPTVSERQRAHERHMILRGFVNCSRFDARKLLGMTLSAATERAMRLHIVVQAVVVNGEELLAEDDYRPNRINVATNNGVITALRGVG
jgi:hypothetical protein